MFRLNSLAQAFYSVRGSPVKRNCSYNYFIIFILYESNLDVSHIFLLFHYPKKEIIGMFVHYKGKMREWGGVRLSSKESRIKSV